MEVIEKLIFDIGMHKGEDTAYYLKQGFRVVAVEANPTLVDECRKKFSRELADGTLTVVNAGISNEIGVMPFYVNLYSSEWSSFDRAIGTRNNTKYEVIDVSCVQPKTLFEQYGIPYYLKVDIEGYDFLVLNDIPNSGPKPTYVSCEANEVEWLDTLYKKGYRRFKLINQANNFKPFNLTRESNGLYVFYRKVKHAIKHKLRNVVKSKFPGGSSGPFGEDTKGNWKTYEEVRQMYVGYMQGDLKTPINYITWLDFHAAL